MERFLSPGWFAQVAGAPAPGSGGGTGPADVVLQQVVTGTPHGEVRYQVSVCDGRATIHEGSPAEADMTFTSDYQTAAAIAAGTLSTEAALIQGRIRVSGNLARLAGQTDALAGAEALAGTRSVTSFAGTEGIHDSEGCGRTATEDGSDGA